MKKTITHTNIQPRLMRMKQLIEYCSLSRAHIYSLISEDAFPKGCMLSAGVKAWERSVVDAWLDKRMGKVA